MENTEFSKEPSEELTSFLKDVMSSIGRFWKMISDKATGDLHHVEYEFLSLKEAVETNPSLFIVGAVVGAAISFSAYGIILMFGSFRKRKWEMK